MNCSFQTQHFPFASIHSGMRLTISYHPFEIEYMHVPLTAIILAGDRIGTVPIEAVHGYQRIDIRQCRLRIIYTMEDATPDAKRVIVNMRGEKVDAVSILCCAITIHERTHQYRPQVLKLLRKAELHVGTLGLDDVETVFL